MSTTITRTVAVTIEAAFAEVMAYLSDLMTYPEWGTEFFAGPATAGPTDGEVHVQVPMMGGPVRMSVAVVAEHGVVDLLLAPVGAPYGPPLPIRVVPNGDGVDVLVTLARAPGMPDPAWEQGVGSMSRELATLKSGLESARRQ